MTYDCCSLPIMEVDAVTEKDVEIQKLRRQRDLLLQENAELREKQRWIPVSERKPKEIKRVFISVPYTDRPEVPPIVEISKFYPTENKWLIESIFDLHPTHWMPLPEAPEVRE